MSKTLSIEQHRLQGTRPTRAKPEEPSGVVAGRPRLPKHLGVEAVKAWKEAVRILRKRGTLSAGDAATLEIYAECKASWIKAKTDVDTRGQILTETRFSKSGDEYQVDVVNPSMKIKAECERQLLALAKSLGLTVVDREKVKKPKPSEEQTTYAAGTAGAAFPDMFSRSRDHDRS